MLCNFVTDSFLERVSIAEYFTELCERVCCPGGCSPGLSGTHVFGDRLFCAKLYLF